MDAVIDADPSVTEVSALCRELFVLPRRARAIRRNEWLLANAERHTDFVRAAAELRRVSPATALLDPVLFSRLTPGFAVTEFVTGATAETLQAPPRELSEPTRAGFASQPSLDRSPRSETQRTGFNPTWWIIGVVFFIIRVGVSISSSSTRPEPQPIQIPPPDWRQTIRPDFSVSDLETFNRFDPESGLMPPLGYQRWILAGKPKTPTPLHSEPKPFPTGPIGPWPTRSTGR